ncbi:MAG: tetratricopeptide repeat protein, partial [Clostridiales bacterium]|nr:tetratricopeptide repeat protein [Clostridiales bacterium]
MINIKAELVNFPPVNIKNLEGQASELSENYRNSITLYNKAIESIKTNSEDIAVIELKKCISLNPEFFEAYNLLGLCLINMKDSKRATEVFEKVITAEANGITAARYLRMLTGVGPGAGAAIGAGMGEYRSGGLVLKKGGALSRYRSDIKERGMNKSTDGVSGSRNADRPGDVSDSRIAVSTLSGSLAGKAATGTVTTGTTTTGTVSGKAAGVDTAPDTEAGLSAESDFKSSTVENNEIKFPGKMGVIYKRGNFGKIDNNRVGNSSAAKSRNENQSHSSLSDNANMSRRQTRGNQAFNSGPEGIESIFPSFGNTKKKEKSSFFKYAAVFLAGALLLLIIKLPFGNSENKAQPTP